MAPRMSILSDIARSWRDPRGLLRDRLPSLREEQALATLMGALLLDWVASLPYAARMARLDPSVPFDARLGGALMGLIFLMPPLMYGLAWVGHAIARRLMRTSGNGRGARFALFQAMLASTPAVLLWGLARGLAGVGALSDFLGLVWAVGFLWIWINMLKEAERA